MKYLKIGLVFFCATLFLASCKNDKKDKSSNTKTAAAKTIDYAVMAEEFCVCMQPLVNLNKEIRSLLEAGETDKVKTLIPQVEKLNTESEACVTELETRYGELTATQEKQAEKAMANVCPDVVKMISSAEKMEQQ